MTQFVIIGGGVAAHEAAAAIRERDDRCGILIVSRERVRPYRRPALSRMVAEELTEQQFYIRPASFYAEKRIELKLDRTVAAIDRAGRRIALADGEFHRYDRLLIAAGGRSFVPPIPGVEQAGVFAIREYADLTGLRAALPQTAGTIAVVGGGLLGLELAEALLRLGRRVAVIESRTGLLPRQLDPPAAALLEAKLRGTANLQLFTGAAPTVLNGAGGRVTGVALTDGRSVDAGLVIFSIGMRPNNELAAAAGLEIAENGGILVDAGLRTADPAIFAAGDCVSVEGHPNSGLYPAAMESGRIAGLNLSGKERVVLRTGAVQPARFQALGVKLFSAGELTGTPEPAEPAGSIDAYRRLYRRDGRLVGAILLGDLREANALSAEMSQG